VELTAAQFSILALLASHPGWVYSRGQIMATVWGTAPTTSATSSNASLAATRIALDSTSFTKNG
jgi:DNA-binding response OmpR family regulator